MNLKEQIQNIIAGDVADDKKTLQEKANDASLFEVMPRLVVYPKNADDIKKLVTFIGEHKGEDTSLSLTARAAGTGMSGGALSESIILDVTKYMNYIGDISETEGIVEPGAYYRDFEIETLKQGVIFPSYPASKRLCAIGGIVGNNAGGEKTLSYGSTKEYVRKLKVILLDGNEYEIKPLKKPELGAKMSQQDFEGEFYRKLFALITENEDVIKKAKPKVSKNSTGYFIWDVWDGETFDLPKLFVGSQGTLGITTEVTFGLIKPKTHSKMVVAFLKDKDFENLGEIVNTVLTHKPETFESYDDETFKLVFKYFPDMVKAMKGRLLTLAWSFIPEAWMVLTKGFPKLVLMAEFTGDSEEEVRAQAEAAHKDIARFGLNTRITTNPQDAEKYWAIRRESFSLLRKHIKKARTAPFIDDIIVLPEQLPEFLPRLNKIMDEYDLVFTIAGHIGDANFHIIPLMDFTKPESKRIFEELTVKVFDLVFEFHGSVSAEHNDGIVRTPYLRKMYGDRVYEIFGEIKDIFDPQNIFNPGKKVDGTWKYTMDHIDTEY